MTMEDDKNQNQVLADETSRMLGLGFILDQVCRFHGQTLLKERQYVQVISLQAKEIARLKSEQKSEDKPNLTALDGGRDKSPEDKPTE